MHEESTGQQPNPESEPRSGPEPRIYVASLSDYNAGRLHGAWIDAWQTPEEMQLDIDDMLADAPRADAEEWAIHDYDDFDAIELREHEPLQHVAWYAGQLREHGSAFAGWFAATGYDPEDGLDFTDVFEGEWPSLEAYVAAYLEDTGLDALLDEAIPGELRAYVQVDIDALARDLQLGGDLITVNTRDGRTWIYRAT
ncbi:MAG: antirestriction protein ArdA [Actinomycetota bacterium]